MTSDELRSEAALYRDSNSTDVALLLEEAASEIDRLTKENRELRREVDSALEAQ